MVILSEFVFTLKVMLIWKYKIVYINFFKFPGSVRVFPKFEYIFLKLTIILPNSKNKLILWKPVFVFKWYKGRFKVSFLFL